MSGLTVSKIWKTSFVKHATENYFHRHTAKGQPKKLAEPELDLLQLLNDKKQTFGNIHGKAGYFEVV